MAISARQTDRASKTTGTTDRQKEKETERDGAVFYSQRRYVRYYQAYLNEYFSILLFFFSLAVSFLLFVGRGVGE